MPFHRLVMLCFRYALALLRLALPRLRLALLRCALPLPCLAGLSLCAALPGEASPCRCLALPGLRDAGPCFAGAMPLPCFALMRRAFALPWVAPPLLRAQGSTQSGPCRNCAIDRCRAKPRNQATRARRPRAHPTYKKCRCSYASPAESSHCWPAQPVHPGQFAPEVAAGMNRLCRQR